MIFHQKHLNLYGGKTWIIYGSILQVINIIVDLISIV